MLDGLDGLVEPVLRLETAIEDYIGAVATIVLYTAGAMHGLRRWRTDAVAAPLAGDTRLALPTMPSRTSTDFQTAAGPVLTLAAGLLKLL